jgi:hypothetical protein
MSKLDETNGAPGGEPNDGTETPPRDLLQQRIRELERENARLRDELARVSELRETELLELQAHRVRNLPASEAEWRSGAGRDVHRRVGCGIGGSE